MPGNWVCAWAPDVVTIAPTAAAAHASAPSLATVTIDLTPPRADRAELLALYEGAW